MITRISLPFLFWLALFFPLGLLHADETKKMTADKERIIKTIRFLSEENFPRTATQENKEKTVNYLIKSMAEAKLEATRHEFSIIRTIGDDYLEPSVPHEDKIIFGVQKWTFTNIHALKKGKTNRRIIIGAHYDAIRESPAADDNASGIAALIELAYLLKETAVLNCDIELVFYDMEENGLYGSQYHAKKLKKQKTDVVCMICMDLVGYYSDEENSQDYPVGGMNLLYGTKGDFLAMVGRAQDTKLITEAHKIFRETTTLRILAIPAPKGLDALLSRSDHAPFWGEGYPALFFTDTADFRNKNYHEKTDTWDTLDYGRLVQVPVGLYHIILAIDAAPLN